MFFFSKFNKVKLEIIKRWFWINLWSGLQIIILISWYNWLSSASSNACTVHTYVRTCTHSTHSLELELGAVIADKTTETWHCLTREEDDEGNEISTRTHTRPPADTHQHAQSGYTHMHTDELIGGLNSWRVQTVQILQNYATPVPGELSVLPAVCRCRLPLIRWRGICHLGQPQLQLWLWTRLI